MPHPHDTTEFWKTAGEAAGVVGTFVGGVWAAVRKIAKEKTAGPEPLPPSTAADDAAKKDLRDEVLWLRQQCHEKDETIKARDEQIRLLYNALDSGSRKGTIENP